MTIPRIPHQNNQPVPSATRQIQSDKHEKARRTRVREAKGTLVLKIPGKKATLSRQNKVEAERVRKEFARLVKSNQLGADPWARLPGETDIQWERFNHYLHLQRQPGQVMRRTYARVSDHFKVGREAVERVAEDWHWKLRAACWDAEIERQEHEAFVSERRANVRKQARLGGKLQDLALLGAENMILTRGLDLTPQDVARLADTGVKIERLAHGDATSHEAKQTEMRMVWEGPVPPWANRSTDVVPIDQNAPQPRLTSGKVEGEGGRDE